MRAIILTTALLLTACASQQPIIDRQNTRYDQCVDRIHEQAAKHTVNAGIHRAAEGRPVE